MTLEKFSRRTHLCGLRVYQKCYSDAMMLDATGSNLVDDDPHHEAILIECLRIEVKEGWSSVDM